MLGWLGAASRLRVVGDWLGGNDVSELFGAVQSPG
jgi:hypothetical protein